MKLWEAIKLLEEGKKIRMINWEKDWYLCLDKQGYIVDEEGYSPTININWQEWEIYKEGDEEGGN